MYKSGSRHFSEHKTCETQSIGNGLTADGRGYFFRLVSRNIQASGNPSAATNANSTNAFR